jgi:hypothetical protein
MTQHAQTKFDGAFIQPMTVLHLYSVTRTLFCHLNVERLQWSSSTVERDSVRNIIPFVDDMLFKNKK